MARLINPFGCFIVLISAVLFGSCTYSFKGASPPEGIKTIYIPNFRDESGFGLPTLSEEMTTLLKGKFINDNTLEYAEKTTADGMLDCIIKGVKDEVQVVSGNEQVSRRKVTIVVSVDFSNLRKQKSIWKKDFSNWGEYSIGAEPRTIALTQAVNKVTEDILIETVSGW